MARHKSYMNHEISAMWSKSHETPCDFHLFSLCCVGNLERFGIFRKYPVFNQRKRIVAKRWVRRVTNFDHWVSSTDKEVLWFKRFERVESCSLNVASSASSIFAVLWSYFYSRLNFTSSPRIVRLATRSSSFELLFLLFSQLESHSFHILPSQLPSFLYSPSSHLIYFSFCTKNTEHILLNTWSYICTHTSFATLWSSPSQLTFYSVS